jgi:hypothetical protein
MFVAGSSSAEIRGVFGIFALLLWHLYTQTSASRSTAHDQHKEPQPDSSSCSWI